MIIDPSRDGGSIGMYDIFLIVRQNLDSPRLRAHNHTGSCRWPNFQRDSVVSSNGIRDTIPPNHGVSTEAPDK